MIPRKDTSVLSLIILLVTAAATFPRGACSHLSANLQVSDVFENAAVYNVIGAVGGSDHQLDVAASELLSPRICPSDLFTLQTGMLMALGPLPQAVLEGPPLCVSDVNLVTAISYECVVRFTDNNMQKLVSIVVNILPEPVSISFPSSAYNGVVLEEEEGAVVNGLTSFQASSVSDFPYSPLQYSIVSGSNNFLIINEIHNCITIPILVVNQTLDAEQTASYELVVEAVHPINATIQSSTSVLVSVVDINDNPPQFSMQQQTTFSTDNNAEVGRVVGNLNVTDEDSGLNGEVVFGLKEPNQFLSIDPISGDLFVIYSLTLVPEEQLVVTVVATDKGKPPRMAEQMFSITITPAPQSAPTINATSTNVTIPEHSAVGTAVTTLQVRTSSTHEPSLSLLGSVGQLFSVSLVDLAEVRVYTYNLTVSGDLDRESLPLGVTLLVVASEGGTPSFNSTIAMTIHLEDINDNAPQFVQAAYFGSVFEGSPSGITIITPLTSDRDVGTNADVQFSLIDPPDLFAVDPSTGSIITAAQVPRGTLSSWTLTLKATDQVHSVTTMVSISVEAYNTQPPTFDTPAPPVGGSTAQSFQPHATVTVSETLAASDPIYTFLATDMDSGCGGRVTYSITLADPPVVIIDGFTGALYPAMDGALDYEQFSSIRVTVRATDNGLPNPLFSEAHLQINVQMANDNPPLIDAITCPCFMHENIRNAQFCRSLSATDQDGDPFSFSILAGNELSHFSIDSTTGRIQTANEVVLNREVVPQYQLTVTASDGVHRSNNVTQVVIVVDVGDTPIRYEPAALSVSVPIDAELGSTVASLFVTANDAGFNGLVTYSASSGLPSSLFNLDPATGDLVVIGDLNVGTTTYSFTVTARERSQSSNTALLTVTLSIAPSLKAPSFRIAEERVVVPQNLQVGAMITEFLATTSSGASVQYTADDLPSVFSLNPSTGALTLQQPLGVSPSVYSVTIMASVAGQPGVTSSQVLEINVYSANGSPNNQPAGMFVCSYSGEIPELTTSTRTVATLNATYLGQPVSYSLEPSTHSSAFSLVGPLLQSRAGVANIFDLTQREAIFLTLRVTYGSAMFYRCAVTVYITDINNHPPTFSQDSYSAEIYRNSPVGTVVFRAIATDIDSSSSSPPRYALQTSTTDFSLNADTGILQLSQSLSSGQIGQYSLILLAIDREDSSLTSQITLSVIVLELSNTAPQPPAVQLFNIPEDTPAESQIASVATVDMDEGVHGRLNYCILSGNLGNRFDVTNEGAILVSEPLDFDGNQRSYKLDVLIFDSSPNPESTITTVNVAVTDVNEAPVFLPSAYKAVVREDSPSLSHIVAVQASDDDTEASRSRVTYSITVGNDDSDLTIDSDTGDIFISSGRSLDREQTGSYQLTVTANNPDASPVVSSMVQVEIEVVDTNDNMPNFISGSDVVRVDENTATGTVIFIASADDSDTGANAEVFYRITTGNDEGLFALDGYNGELTLVRDLDHESSPNLISLEVVALDVEGITSSTLQLAVQVIGINEHPPSFTQYLYTATVQEEATMNTVVRQVSAVDYDKDGNTVMYSLTGDGESDFTISTTGMITTARSIDREQTPYYFLTVWAMDDGSPRRSAAAVVHIVVQDVNDNSPQLESSYSVSLPEDQPLNVPFFILQATDNDEGQNAEVVYSIEPAAQSSWGVGPTSGALYLKRELDFESATSHSFVVMARNTEFPQVTVQTTINIEVVDVPENTASPRFLPDLSNILPIPATASVGAILANITAVDPDPGRDGEVVYTITGGTGMQYFSINNITGEVVLLQPLSSATVSSLTLEVQASDSSVFPLFTTQQFVIQLTTPTLPPRFTSPTYHFSVQEDSLAGTSIGLVALTEAYAGHLETVSYSIEAGNQGDRFHINSTNGIISVLGSLNRENIQEYHLQVTAMSSDFPLQPAHTLVSVSVLDQNDNRPAFQPSNSYVVNMFNNFPASSSRPIIRVFALDPDDPAANGRVTYMRESSNTLFAVSSDGVVYLTSAPSGTSNTLTVKAVDSATEALDSTATVAINVVSPAGSVMQPNYSPSSSMVTIAEDVSIGTVVTTATAIDGDSPVIMYQILSSSSPSSQQHFAIHPNTGTVYVADRLNRETLSSYTLHIEAWDGHTTTVFTLTVTVTDVNDNIPQFSSSRYFFSVSETALVNAQVGNLAISDEDINSNGRITLDIVDSTAAEGIFGFAGLDVVVRGPIDREVLPVHYLTVRGRDQGNPPLESYCTVVVEIEDVNNNSPTFSSSLFHVSVNESASVRRPIAAITAFDLDRGSNGDVIYAISPSSSQFSIDESTGELSLISQLNFATKPTHTLTIVASDRGTPSNSGSTTVLVTVLPDFTSPPNINDPGMVSISENLPPNTMVSSVAGVNDVSVSYILDGGEGYFWIDSKTGMIRTSMSLDREVRASYLLSATVRYVGILGATNSVTFTVNVADVNDNAPRLSSSQDITEVTVREDTQPTLTAFSLSVEDIDSGNNANIENFIILHPVAAEYFLVEADGQAKLLQSLDVEGNFGYLDVPIAMNDAATPTQLAVQYVHLLVEDSNDESPMFSRDVYSAVLLTPASPGSSILHVSATDSDSGIGGVVEFSITGGNGSSRFAINSQNGEVSLDNPYKLQALYHLQVTATDKGTPPHFSTADVFVTVRDCPLLAFRFTPQEYSFMFPENAAVNTIIVTPVLIHIGIGTSAIRFSLLSGESDIFRVDQFDGTVSLRSTLDREKQEEHQLAIQARHITDDTLIADLSVTVAVHDVNDNAPQFTSVSYQSSVINSASVSHPVVHIIAVDPDVGNSGQVSYSIINGGLGFFSINEVTGQVSVSGNLESLQSGSDITLTVEARDQGNPVSLSNTTTVSILIVDSQAPAFTQDLYRRNVSEATGIGTHVITVMATVHSGFPTYIIESGDSNNQFNLDFYSGEVTVEKLLNYELINRYSLLLRVSDPTLPETSFNLATLEIDIVDVNDNSPIFSPNIYSSILFENSTRGTEVALVTATDLDAEGTDNSRITYAFLADFPYIGIFTVDSSSGQITLMGEIDFETNPVYEFSVYAIDAGPSRRTGSATVRLSVVNVNDNSPVFVMALFELSVQESAFGGSVVGSVNALDPDLDSITYSITGGNEDGLFLIDLQTGEIRLSLTASGFNETAYNLTVSAFDGQLYGAATARVSIADINDNSPVFNQTVYEGTVRENSGTNVAVLQVSATDKDRISGIVLQYSLSTSVMHFKIDPVTGQISTKRTIDREQDPEFEFHVFVTDSLLTGSALVRVTVIDENDNGPVFRPFAVYEAQVKENAAVQSTVASVTANDLDEGSNAVISYSLGTVTEPSDLDPNFFPFSIDTTSGAIRVRSLLNFETTFEYIFTIVATDKGTIMRSTERQFMIEVLDVSDTPPVFEQSSYNFSILEEPSDRSIPVGRVVATSDSSEPIDYIIIGSGSSQLPFGINQMSGDIIVDGFIDREFQSEHLFTVEAYTFVNNRQLKSSVPVTITVLDKNDNRPQFSVPRYQGQVAENRPSNTPIEPSGSSIIQATDRDNGENGTVMYRIMENNVPFIIDSNGQIFTTRGFDREDQDQFSFTVIALDQGSPPLTSTAFVRATITILDVNDHSPTFQELQYSAQVAEDAGSGDTVATVPATDRDLGENADIVYTLQGSTLFDINRETGMVFVSGTLDREAMAQHNLMVDAYDGANRNSVPLVVTVTDVNDEPPVFNSSDYTATVEENTPTDIPLLSVRAEDPDQTGTITYSVVGPSRDNFTINPISGELRFRVSPNYEEFQQVEIQVAAADGVHEVLEAVTVYITDMNDERPSFTMESFSGSVQENRAELTNVVKLSATDGDSGEGGIVTYQIVGGRIGNESVTDVSQLPFRLTTLQSGLVVTTQELNREAVSEYTLTVRASDRGDPSLSSTTTVSITVLDDNDHSPIFLQPMYEAGLSESSPLETHVETVTATDGDSGSNAMIFYSLHPSNNSQHFSIDRELGRIAVAESLDFETQPTYHLTVIASDQGQVARSGTAIIVINLSDENDNSPVFQQPSYLKIVSEDTEVGSSLLQVIARDQDTGDAAIVVYSIVDGSALPEFRIDPNTGMLFVDSKLDFERQRQYQFRVRAENAGDSSQFSTARINITLTDVNDEVPVFVPPNPVFRVTEEMNPEITLGTVSATDPDSVTNPDDITFSIVSGNEQGFFSLNTDSGLLITKVRFNREERATYRLTVTADDGGIPSQTGTTQITVVIDDINDNDPKGGHADIFVYLLAEEFVPGLIGQVNANDPDVVNTHVYTLQTPTVLPSPFILNSNGTFESTSKPSIGTFQFEVSVMDNSPPVLCTVMIIVESIEKEVAERSITIRLRGNSAQEFLEEKVMPFTSGGAPIFQAVVPGSGSPFVVSTQVVDEVDEIIDVSFSVPLSDGTGYVDQELVRHIVHTSRSQFASSEIGINVETELPDLCVTEPCGTNGICRNVLTDVDSTLLSLSPAYAIVAPSPLWDYQCVCLPGISGRHCDSGSVDFCSLTPCPSPMTCTNGAAGTTCGCPEGSHNQNDVCTVNQTACMQLDCQNGGSCVVTEEGLSCACPEGYVGSRCTIEANPPNLCLFAACQMGSTCTYSHVGFTCTCPPGQSGVQCINATEVVSGCGLNPCQAGGTCNTDGNGYSCTCPEGYSGADCEVFLFTDSTSPSSACDSAECSEEEDCVEVNGELTCLSPCSPNPCLHGGSCVRQLPGFTCDCPEQYQGPRCEVTLASFAREGFAVFPSIHTPLNSSVYLEFATDVQSGLLFLNGRYDEEGTDFISLELLQGRLKYSLSRGEAEQTVLEYSQGVLTDREWHSIVAGFNATHMWMFVDDCANGNVDLGPVGRVDGPLDTPTCNDAVTVISGTYSSLDVTAPLIMGSHPVSFNYGPEASYFSFQGFIRNMRISDVVLDFSTPLTSEGVSSSLSLENDPCSSAPCQNRAQCIPSGYTYVCLCGSAFTGENCQDVAPSASFSGTNLISFSLIGSVGRVTRQSDSLYSTRVTTVTFGFSAISNTGTLFGMTGPSDYTYIELERGYLQFRYNLGSGEVVAMVTGRQFGEGDYHEVEVQREGRTALIWVDSLYVAMATAPGLDTLLDVHPNAIFLGASSGASSGAVENGFMGCLRGATLDGKLLPLSGSNEDFEVSYSGLDTPTFDCWVPPTVGLETPVSPVLPYLYVIVIVAVVALLLLVVAFIVTVVIARWCRKKRKGGGASLFEMRDVDFVLGAEIGPRLVAEYREEEQGVTRNSAGNIRSYDHEGGGESDIRNGLQLEMNSTVSQTASTDELLRTEGSMFSTFSSAENTNRARAALPSQLSPMLNSRPSREAAEDRLPERHVMQIHAAVSNAGAMANSPEVLPRQPPTAGAAAAVVSNPAPRRDVGQETAAAVASHPAPRRGVGQETPAAAAKPKPVSVDVPVPPPKPHSKPKSHLIAQGKQILKRKQAADAQVLQDDYDETTTFKEEGNLTPLRYTSLKSLYRMQDEEDDDTVPNITGPSAPRFSHLLSLLEQLNVTDDDASSTCTAETFTSDAMKPKVHVAHQLPRPTPPPIPVKKHKSRIPATSVTVRQV